MTVIGSISAFLQILLIDISLTGDNALVVGMVASSLPPSERPRAIIAGVLGATIFRILFASVAVRLLHIVGLLAAGGLVLLWVAYKMYRDLCERKQARLEQCETPLPSLNKTVTQVVLQIVVADISMSLDNVLAVAGVARDHMGMLVVGLIMSVAFMGVLSHRIALITERRPEIGYIGLVVVLVTSLRMIWDGLRENVL